MKIIDNINSLLGDDLKASIHPAEPRDLKQELERLTTENTEGHGNG